MWRACCYPQFFILALMVSGCGSSQSPSPSPGDAKPRPAAQNKSGPGPEVAVGEFLEAVRTGNDAQAAQMLTPLARKKTSEMSLVVSPPGSETARFKVEEVEYVAEDGAHVASAWTDLNDEGQPHTDKIVWMVRREEEGWRIAGMATQIFEDMEPLFLNFEDPEDMVRKQRLAAEEVARRLKDDARLAEPVGSAKPSAKAEKSDPATKSQRR